MLVHAGFAHVYEAGRRVLAPDGGLLPRADRHRPAHRGPDAFSSSAARPRSSGRATARRSRSLARRCPSSSLDAGGRPLRVGHDPARRRRRHAPRTDVCGMGGRRGWRCAAAPVYASSCPRRVLNGSASSRRAGRASAGSTPMTAPSPTTRARHVLYVPTSRPHVVTVLDGGLGARRGRDRSPIRQPVTDALVAARVVAFAAPAALSTTQDVVRLVRPALGAGADAGVVAEETLALVATLTARAAETGLRRAATRSRLPARPSPSSRSSTTTTCSAARWWRRAPRATSRPTRASTSGWTARRPSTASTCRRGAFPGPSVLARSCRCGWAASRRRASRRARDERLGALGVADLLAVHARLVLAFAQKAAEDGMRDAG